MIDVRKAESDEDLEAFRAIRLAVLPDERAPSVEELRQTAAPDDLFVLAESAGEVVGAGLAKRSSHAGRVFVAPRVLPDARRRGVGTALLGTLVEHAASLDVEALHAFVDDVEPEAVAFARRFGFEEVDRQVEQVRRLGDEPAPDFPDGIEVVTIADRPELLEAAYELGAQGYADMATPWPASITLDEWLREEATHPAGSFVALANGDIVGYSGLMRDADEATRAEDGLTVVRSDWRRRGLASALKRAELAWAAATGLREVYTWTQRGNEGMRQVNEQLGYLYRHIALTVSAPLELVHERLAANSPSSQLPRSCR